MNEDKRTLKFGFYTAISLIVMTIITWILAMKAVPASGPYCPGDCMDYPFEDLILYYPRDYLWMYLAVIQVFAYLIFIISNHFTTQNENKLFSFLSIAFAVITATVLLIVYFVQFSVVPISVMNGETDGVALLTQYNDHGIFIAMEELGYITMSISFLFLAFIFTNKTRLEKSLRIILILGFIFTVFSFVFYSVNFGIDRSYRFEVAAISINWITTITTGILVSIFMRKRLKKIK